MKSKTLTTLATTRTAMTLAPCRVVKTLRPTQPSTLKLHRRYGDALLCVRYREDASGTTRYTTVELVVDTAPVQRRLTDRTIVGVRIAWGEATLSARARKHWAPSGTLLQNCGE